MILSFSHVAGGEYEDEAAVAVREFTALKSALRDPQTPQTARRPYPQRARPSFLARTRRRPEPPPDAKRTSGSASPNAPTVPTEAPRTRHHRNAQVTGPEMDVAEPHANRGDLGQPDPLGCQRSVGYQACARESVREDAAPSAYARKLTRTFVRPSRAAPAGFPARFATSPRLRSSGDRARLS